MESKSRSRFARRLRSLGDDARRRFVARLWTARGYDVTVTGEGFRGADPRTGTRITVAVEPRARLLVARRASVPEDADVVVWLARRSPPATDARVLDLDDLHEMAHYGIDREALDDLWRETFDTPLSEEGAPRFDLPVDLPDASSSRVRLALAGFVVALLVATGSAILSGGGVDGGRMATSSGDVGTIRAGGTETPAPVQTPVSHPAPTCPEPPRNLDPDELRPAVVTYSSPRGLEGWRLVHEAAFGGIVGPHAQPTSLNPAAKFVGTYESPAGDRYRLDISRWHTREHAVRVTAEEAPDDPRWIRWGNYTLSVTAFAGEGGQFEGPIADAQSRQLLANVVHLEHGKIGESCVAALQGMSHSEPPS